MLDCSVSAASETSPTTSVPFLSLKLPCGTVPRCLSLFLTFVCMVVCVGAHAQAMTHVEVTGQFSGVIFSHHRDLGTELKSLGVAAGAFTRSPLVGTSLSIYNAHSYQEALEKETTNAWRRFHLLAGSRTLLFFISSTFLKQYIACKNNSCRSKFIMKLIKRNNKLQKS